MFFIQKSPIGGLGGVRTKITEVKITNFDVQLSPKSKKLIPDKIVYMLPFDSDNLLIAQPFLKNRFMNCGVNKLRQGRSYEKCGLISCAALWKVHNATNLQLYDA
jgi:hypothetical protein